MALNPFEQLQFVTAEPRQAFEDAVADIVRLTVGGSRRIRVYRGDGGVDAFTGDFTQGIDVYQMKYFSTVWGDSQKRQIRESYAVARNCTDFKLQKWCLCVPTRLTKEDIRWFDTWRNEQDVPIELIDGDDLTTLLQKEECGTVRQKLSEWGVMGLQTDRPKFEGRIFIRKENPEKSGLTFVLIILLKNEGSRTAKQFRVRVGHSETNCVAHYASEDLWQQRGTGALRPLNPRDLVAINPLNPKEEIPVLSIPICERSASPFEVQIQVYAEDIQPTVLSKVLLLAELQDRLTVRLEGTNIELQFPTAEIPDRKPTPPSSPLAKEILKLILAHPKPEEHGLTEILKHYGSPLEIHFLPHTAGNGDTLVKEKREFKEAVAELTQLGWLLPPEETEKTRIYQLNLP